MAQALDELRRLSEAAADWQRAIGFDDRNDAALRRGLDASRKRVRP